MKDNILLFIHVAWPVILAFMMIFFALFSFKNTEGTFAISLPFNIFFKEIKIKVENQNISRVFFLFLSGLFLIVPAFRDYSDFFKKILSFMFILIMKALKKLYYSLLMTS